MGVAMIRDRRGLTALFDALVFLTIIAVVSTTLLSFYGDHVIKDRDTEDNDVEVVHQVLLRTTVVDPTGNPCSLEDLFTMDDIDASFYSDTVRSILDLLAPGHGWRWTICRSDREWSIGDNRPDGGEVHCSIVSAPYHWSELEFRLEIWPS
jgi:hypothetical protein